MTREKNVLAGKAAEGRAARLIGQGVLKQAAAAAPRHVLATDPPARNGPAILSRTLIDERRNGR